MEKLIIYFLLFLAITHSYAQEIVVKDDMIHISEDETIYINGSFEAERDAKLNNKGNIIFTSDDESEIINNSNSKLFYGEGKVVLESDSKQTISGQNDIEVSTIEINNESDEGVVLETNLSVMQQLTTNSGIVNTGENIVWVDNENDEAITATEYSYINGNLKRTIVNGTDYLYPIGNSELYYPIKLSSNQKEMQYITASFQSITPEETDIRLFDQGYIFDTLCNEGQWLITSSEEKPDFELEAYTYNFEEEFNQNDYKYAIVQKPSQTGEYKIAGNADYNHEVDIDISVLAHTITDNGYFAIAKSFTPDLYQYNTIVVNGESETRFIIPGIEKYDNTHLSIYSRWGNILHEQNDYDNSFDFKSYNEGTYYYVLQYTNEGTEQTLKDFIEVIK